MLDLEHSLRAQFPSPTYRVSRYTYPAGTAFAGAMQASTCHVLQGSCSFTFGDENFQISAGQQHELREGSHRFQVHSAEDVILLMVWRAPSARRL